MVLKRRTQLRLLYPQILVCQGEQVPVLWPLIFATGHRIVFAHTSFKWANLKSQCWRYYCNHCNIKSSQKETTLILEDQQINTCKERNHQYGARSPISSYPKPSKSPPDRGVMVWATKPTPMEISSSARGEKLTLLQRAPSAQRFIRRYFGSAEFIRGDQRYCLWIRDDEREQACPIPEISSRIEKVRLFRAKKQSS